VHKARSLGRPHCLIITASSDPAIHAQALAAGATHILRKPLAMPELREVLGRLTDNTLHSIEDEKELAALAHAARTEIRLRARELVDAARGGVADAAAAHRLAGLAAQFLWPDLAAAADALSMALKDDARASGVTALADMLEKSIPGAE
jgi:DNA-binding response OmpR family regulator